MSGFIKIRKHDLLEETARVIDAFPYDPIFPFTNIFWCASRADYNCPVVGFVGSYKQIEEHWNGWLSRFGELLSCVDAIEAHASLSCILGDYEWTLRPKRLFEDPGCRDSMLGQVWGVSESPVPDFSTDPVWLAQYPVHGFDPIERWTRA